MKQEEKIGPQCVLVWNFIDKVVARGFWAEANLLLTVSQLYYYLNNFCAGMIWYRFTGGIWGINLYFYQAICLSLPPWKLFGVFLNVWSSSSTNKLPLGGLGYLFVYTAILEILGAGNIFHFTTMFVACCFFWYPGVFQDGRDLNAICASPRILHFVHGFVLAFFPCELRLLFI